MICAICDITNVYACNPPCIQGSCAQARITALVLKNSTCSMLTLRRAYLHSLPYHSPLLADEHKEYLTAAAASVLLLTTLTYGRDACTCKALQSPEISIDPHGRDEGALDARASVRRRRSKAAENNIEAQKCEKHRLVS
eukprot:gnl/TRDRNA2_/TRDRNA2_65136_c0_seq1.p1 gnl/TRDRNA2_/TRDRNA2_65136_c0~~gnl/TRDRNA2_/TRDRNA2_65136_c0_seq1.p1  ORF type:complete len:139 (+),score=12.02 gnl/TRDRNA2_/TRDRNA2_65136_c0_seq1:103-519(+)